MSDNDLTVVRGGKILLPTDLKMDFSLLRYCHFKPKMIVFLTALYVKTTKQVMILRLPHLNTGTGFFCCSGLLCRYFCFWCWFWWSGGLYKNAVSSTFAYSIQSNIPLLMPQIQFHRIYCTVVLPLVKTHILVSLNIPYVFSFVKTFIGWMWFYDMILPVLI